MSFTAAQGTLNWSLGIYVLFYNRWPKWREVNKPLVTQLELSHLLLTERPGRHGRRVSVHARDVVPLFLSSRFRREV